MYDVTAAVTKLSAWSCLEIRMEGELTVWGLIIVPSRGGKSLNIWEQLLQIKILLQKKLRADWGQEMLAIIGAESFVFQVAIQKFKDQDF